MRSAKEIDAVMRLIAAGLNDCAIARQTGVPRPMVWGLEAPITSLVERLACAL
jgi:hypothetical protein